jgi:hypothetical protein
MLVGVAMATPMLIAACDTNDGRVLRDPCEGTENSPPTTACTRQNDSISTTAPPETDDPSVDPPLFEDLPTTSSSSPGSGAVTVFAPWQNGGEIGDRFTCDGQNVAPPLSWAAAPEGTVSIAVSLIDDDVPQFGHWAMSGIPASAVALAEGVVPAGASVAVNGEGVAGYTGPCPPAETSHQYRITVYYLEAPVEIAGGNVVDVLAELQLNSVAIAEIVGTYSRI